jgi:hypothetical protein
VDAVVVRLVEVEELDHRPSARREPIVSAIRLEARHDRVRDVDRVGRIL